MSNTIKSLLGKLFGDKDEDLFITFVQVALENETIRQQLIELLSLEDPLRSKRLREWQNQLQTQGAHADFIQAVSFLNDPAKADKTLEILRKGGK